MRLKAKRTASRTWLVDDGIFAGLVLFEIVFESFVTGGEDGSLDDVDHLFGMFEGQWLLQLIAVIFQNVLDCGNIVVITAVAFKGDSFLDET